MFSGARSQLLGRLTGPSRVQSPRLCWQLLDAAASRWAADCSGGTRRASVFFHLSGSFSRTSRTWNPSALIPTCCFAAGKVRGHGWMRDTYGKKEKKKKKEKQWHVSSFMHGKSNFQCICVCVCVRVCTCVLSPKRAENCKLSSERQRYKQDTFKRQPWHGCLFPDDNQWHIHFPN